MKTLSEDVVSFLGALHDSEICYIEYHAPLITKASVNQTVKPMHTTTKKLTPKPCDIE